MIRLLGIICESPKKIQLVFSHWSDHLEEFSQLARDVSVWYCEFAMGLSHVHLGDVAMYNLSHLIGSENLTTINQLKGLLKAGPLFITNGFIRAQFMDILVLVNGGLVPSESSHLFPSNGDVFQPTFPQVSPAQYARCKAIAEGRTPLLKLL